MCPLTSTRFHTLKASLLQSFPVTQGYFMTGGQAAEEDRLGAGTHHSRGWQPGHAQWHENRRRRCLAQDSGRFPKWTAEPRPGLCPPCTAEPATGPGRMRSLSSAGPGRSRRSSASSPAARPAPATAAGSSCSRPAAGSSPRTPGPRPRTAAGTWRR